MEEKRFTIDAPISCDVCIETTGVPKRLYLLLHGFMEKGNFILKKLLPHLPTDSIIIAPNGIYPLPQKLDTRFRLHFAWYFFDTFNNSYYIDQLPAANYLKKLVDLNNPKKLPITVIGFSQGGYLAPFVGKELALTEHVVGIGCVYRKNLLDADKLEFKLDAIHGDKDDIVDMEGSRKAFEEISEITRFGTYYEIPDTGHEINNAVIDKLKEIL